MLWTFPGIRGAPQRYQSVCGSCLLALAPQRYQSVLIALLIRGNVLLVQLLQCTTRTSRLRRCGSSSRSMTRRRRRRRPVAAKRRRFRSCLGCMRMFGLPCSSAELSSAVGWGRCWWFGVLVGRGHMLSVSGRNSRTCSECAFAFGPSCYYYTILYYTICLPHLFIYLLLCYFRFTVLKWPFWGVWLVEPRGPSPLHFLIFFFGLWNRISWSMTNRISHKLIISTTRMRNGVIPLNLRNRFMMHYSKDKLIPQNTIFKLQDSSEKNL